MSRYVVYNPEQDWLLPPSIVDELGDDHLALFIHRLVERLDLGAFEADRREQGRPGYPPQLLLKVWLYAYCVGVTSSPGAAEVAIDATRIAGNASAERSDTLEQLHPERARIRQRIRRWQKECERQDDDAPGTKVEQTAQWQQRLEEIPRQMEQLRKSGQWRGSRTDPESRYLRKRGGSCLGFTAEVAVSDDHLIVAQRVHQQTTDNGSAAQMTEAVEQQCGQRPEVVVADSGYYNMEEIRKVETGGSQAIVPDPLLARELMGGPAAPEMNARQQRRTPGLRKHREKLRQPTARQHYQPRKAVVEPIWGTLKQHRGMRQFRRRGLSAVSTEWVLATTAYNLTRMFNVGRAARC